MRGLFTTELITIAPGSAISGVAAREQTLRIASGRVWLTVEGISHDYFLHAGDTFTAIPGRWVVIEADQEARIDFLQPQVALAAHGIRRWLRAAREQLTQGGTVQTQLKQQRSCNAC